MPGTSVISEPSRGRAMLSARAGNQIMSVTETFRASSLLLEVESLSEDWSREFDHEINAKKAQRRVAHFDRHRTRPIYFCRSRACATIPSRPIQLVVAYPEGGTGEIVGRPLAEKLTALLNQTVNSNTGRVPAEPKGQSSSLARRPMVTRFSLVKQVNLSSIAISFAISVTTRIEISSRSLWLRAFPSR